MWPVRLPRSHRNMWSRCDKEDCDPDCPSHRQRRRPKAFEKPVRGDRRCRRSDRQDREGRGGGATRPSHRPCGLLELLRITRPPHLSASRGRPWPQGGRGVIPSLFKVTPASSRRLIETTFARYEVELKESVVQRVT